MPLGILKSKIRSWGPPQLFSYYNYVISTWYNYYNYISNKGLLEEWDKVEKLSVTWAATASCLKRRL